MQDNSNFERREMAEQVREMQQTLNMLVDNIHSSFAKDEDGKPDFYRHREDHKEIAKQREAEAEKKQAMVQYQNRFTEKIVVGAAGLIVTLIAAAGSGIGDAILSILRSK